MVTQDVQHVCSPNFGIRPKAAPAAVPTQRLHVDVEYLDPVNVPLLRALWSLLDGIWGVLKGSWGVLVWASIVLPRVQLVKGARDVGGKGMSPRGSNTTSTKGMSILDYFV